MTDEQLPPSDVASERALLAVCIQSPAAHKEALGLITATDFYIPHHAVLWELMDEMLALGRGIDFTSLYAAARSHKRESVRRDIISNHATFLPDLLQHPAVAASTGYYCELIAAAAQRRRLVAIGQRIVQRASTEGVDEVELIDWASGQVKEVRDQRRGVEMLTVPVDEFMNRVPEHVNAVIPQLLFQGDRLVITGSGGLGKSELMWQLAICAAIGEHPFNPRIEYEPQRVTVIDRENTERQSQLRLRPLLAMARVRGHKRGLSISDRLNVHAKGQSIDLLNPTEAMSVLRTIEHDKPDLVYIGPAYKLHNDDPDKEAVIKRLMHVLDQIREMGCAVMIEAHANKSESMAPSGSNIWSWWPEFGFGLKLLPGSDREVRWCALTRWRFERDSVAEWPEALIAGGDWRWRSTTLPANPDN